MGEYGGGALGVGLEGFAKPGELRIVDRNLVLVAPIAAKAGRGEQDAQGLAEFYALVGPLAFEDFSETLHDLGVARELVNSLEIVIAQNCAGGNAKRSQVRTRGFERAPGARLAAATEIAQANDRFRFEGADLISSAFERLWVSRIEMEIAEDNEPHVLAVHPESPDLGTSGEFSFRHRVLSAVELGMKPQC